MRNVICGLIAGLMVLSSSALPVAQEKIDKDIQWKIRREAAEDRKSVV